MCVYIAFAHSEMAEASVSEEHFICQVCLDLLMDPVTVPCGHSFCMSCITDCWDQKKVCICPQCRQTFSPRPDLGKNTIVAEVVKQLRKTRLQNAVPAASAIEPGNVECDVCTGKKHKAVKSCLVCLESYCQTHFERHEEFHSGKRHQSMDATGQMQQMICRQHDKILEVFCETDQQYICMLCVMDEHKNHDIVSAAAKRTQNERHLKEIQSKLQQTIQKRQKDLQQLREAVESHKRSAQTAVDDSERNFKELIHCIKKSNSEVSQRIRDQEKTAVSRAEGLMEQLEQEIEELKRRDTELEQLSHTVFTSLPSLSTPPESTSINAINFFFSFDGVRLSVSQLRKKLEDLCTEEMKKISVTHTNIVPKTREDFLLYFHQLTLDPNTAHNNLLLSEGNTVVTYTNTLQPYPDHPDRFDKCFQVLGKERVCGRCYWEVEWSQNVHISVLYKSMGRKGNSKEFRFGCNDQSWSLFCSALTFSFWHNSIVVELPVPSNSCRIGVYVDHNVGTLAFYSVTDTMKLIYRIKTTFTQPLYPGFVVGYKSSLKLC